MNWEDNRTNGNTAYENGDYAQAIKDLKLARAELESNGHNEQHLADVLTELGKVQDKAADYESAKVTLNKAISIYHHAKMDNSVEAAKALEILGRVHAEQSNFSEATKLINSAYALKKKFLKEPNPDVAQTLDNLAVLANRQGDHKQAEQLWQQSFDMRKATLGEEHKDYAQSLGDLALIYSVTGRMNEAQPMLEKALQIKEKVQGPEHPSVGYTLLALGGLHQKKMAFAAAEPYFERAVAIFEKKLGTKHSHTAVALNNFGAFYLAQGKLKEATTYFERALESKDQLLGKDNPALIKNLRNLAITYEKLNQNQQAQALEERAKNILVKQTADPDNRDNHIFISLADLYTREEKFDEALKVLKKGVDHAKRIYGPESLELARMLEFLAGTLRYKHLKAEAKDIPKAIQRLKEFTVPDQKTLEGKDSVKRPELSEENKKVNEQIKGYLATSLRIKQKLFGNEHPEIAKTLTQLSECFTMAREFRTSQLLQKQAKAIELKTGGVAKMEHLMRRMLEEQRQKGDLDSRSFLSSLEGLALHLERSNKEQEAGPLYDEYVQRLEKCLGKDPSELASEFVEVSVHYKNRGKTGKAVELAEKAVALLEKLPELDLRKKTNALQTLALCYESDNNLSEAERVYQNFLQLEEQQFGSHNWRLKGPLTHLSSLCTQLNRQQEADSYAERAKSLPEPTKEETEAHNKAVQDEFTQHLKDSMIEYLGKMAEQFSGRTK